MPDREVASLMPLIAKAGGSPLSLWHTWRRLPGGLWLLISARGVNQLGAFTLSFLTVLLARRLHVQVTAAGALMAIFGAATIPGRLLGGRLSDRIGPIPTIVIGLLATAAGQLALVMVSSFRAALLCLVVLGLAFEIYEPPSQALVADLVDQPDRPTAYGAYSAVLAAAAILAGLLAATVGRLGLSWLFMIDAGTCVVAAILIGTMLRVPGHQEPAASESPPEDPGTSLWRNPAVLVMLATATVFATLYIQVSVLAPLTLVARHLPASDFGILSVVSALTIVGGQALLSRRGTREPGPFTAMAVSYVLLGLGFLGYGFARSLWQFGAATLLWSVGDLVLLGRATAVMASIAPADARGRYMAVYGISWGVALVVGPAVGTQLLARWGVLPAWAAIAVTCAVLASVQPLAARVVSGRIADSKT
jgi:MFS family permease